VVCSRDFETMAAAAAGRPLDTLFDAWLRRAELPEL